MTGMGAAPSLGPANPLVLGVKKKQGQISHSNFRFQSRAKGSIDLREQEHNLFHLAATSTLGRASSTTVLCAFFCSMSQPWWADNSFSLSGYCHFLRNFFFFFFFLDHSSFRICIFFHLNLVRKNTNPHQCFTIFPISLIKTGTFLNLVISIIQNFLHSPSIRSMFLSQMLC